ncbi:hydrolase 1, exosortase A system-associated [Novosphingobium sp.]|uniref:hydrolase 1, exosortase A system-associated n=1 Tax=Novosphingobium sp. TaxID=1874826 RepID=UPI002FDED3E5
MNRQVVTFPCAGETLLGTLDMDGASGATGLLIVSGGNEIRAGTWGGQARLSRQLAEAGVPVFRYDRRGVGDSTGTNQGFDASGPDIAAALAAFRSAAPHVKRVVAFGNCDAASALILHATSGIASPPDALVLGNPWTIDQEGDGGDVADAPPVHSAAALRRHYARRLADPRQWLRLLGGKVGLSGLARGLRTAASAQAPSTLAERMRSALAAYTGPVTFLVAEGDRTAQLFRSHWGADARIVAHPGASHSFSDAREWLCEQLLGACR